VTFLGSLPGHGKTWVLLSIIKALLSGEPLFGYFKVLVKTIPRVVYLSPEVQLGQVRIRVERMGLGKYVENGQLLIRTLTEGPRPDLLDPDIRMAARGAVVILDTAVRFMEGKENDSDSNRDGLGSKCFALLNAGAQFLPHYGECYGDSPASTGLPVGFRAGRGSRIATVTEAANGESDYHAQNIVNKCNRDFDCQLERNYRVEHLLPVGSLGGPRRLSPTRRREPASL
jgi:hypothetical protein